MISSIRVVIFDLGRTLIYDQESWHPYYQRANIVLLESLQKAGLHFDISTFFHAHRGLLDLYYPRRGDDVEEETTAVFLKQLLEEQGNQNIRDEIIAEGLRAMYAVTQENWLVEEDAIQTLQTLKENGFRIGLISNAGDDENTQTLIDKGGLRPYLEFIISSAASGKRKPHPAIFESALNHFQVNANQAVMVGDLLETDILGAHKVGMKSIWITRRAIKTANKIKVKPDAVVSTL